MFSVATYTVHVCTFIKCHVLFVYSLLKALQDYKSSSVTQLQKENAMLEENKRELEEELLSLRQELVSSKETSNSKEIQVLKKVVKNLEVCIKQLVKKF